MKPEPLWSVIYIIGNEPVEEVLQMKRSLFLIMFIAIMIPLTAIAQQQTLITGKMTHGGAAGPVLKYSKMLGQDALLVGGRGGWIIGSALWIGGAGYGLVNRVESLLLDQDTEIDSARYLGLGYGGLELGFIVASDRLVHLTGQVLIGAGGAVHTKRDGWDDFEIDPDNEEGDSFFILEPAVDVEVNITTFFRICLGASYRWVTGIEINEFTNKDISGFSGVLTLKFGRF